MSMMGDTQLRNEVLQLNDENRKLQARVQELETTNEKLRESAQSYYQALYVIRSYEHSTARAQGLINFDDLIHIADDALKNGESK